MVSEVIGATLPEFSKADRKRSRPRNHLLLPYFFNGAHIYCFPLKKMKRAVYTRFLEITSAALNVCVRFHMWALAKNIIEFRKKNIARVLRKELATL